MSHFSAEYRKRFGIAPTEQSIPGKNVLHKKGTQDDRVVASTLLRVLNTVYKPVGRAGKQLDARNLSPTVQQIAHAHGLLSRKRG